MVGPLVLAGCRRGPYDGKWLAMKPDLTGSTLLKGRSLTMSTRTRWTLALLSVVALSISACSSSTPASPEARLAHTWQATSFVALDQDFVLQGLDLTVTLTSTGTYSLNINNDLIGACDGDTNCTQTGTYTATDTEITLDPSDSDPTTFDYTLSGTTLVLDGDIDGTPVTITLARA